MVALFNVGVIAIAVEKKISPTLSSATILGYEISKTPIEDFGWPRLRNFLQGL